MDFTPKPSIESLHSLASLPTYTVGIAQASAYRLLKKFTEICIANHDLTMMQWYIIGNVYESGTEGTTASQLADYLDTTVPYITNTINVLETKSILTRVSSIEDSRVKRVVLVGNYSATVQQIEVDIRHKMRSTLYKNITPAELKTYIKVLYKFNALLDASNTRP